MGKTLTVIFRASSPFHTLRKGCHSRYLEIEEKNYGCTHGNPGTRRDRDSSIYPAVDYWSHSIGWLTADGDPGRDKSRNPAQQYTSNLPSRPQPTLAPGKPARSARECHAGRSNLDSGGIPKNIRPEFGHGIVKVADFPCPSQAEVYDEQDRAFE